MAKNELPIYPLLQCHLKPLPNALPFSATFSSDPKAGNAAPIPSEDDQGKGHAKAAARPTSGQLLALSHPQGSGPIQKLG
jgi:hypothetical protein